MHLVNGRCSRDKGFSLFGRFQPQFGWCAQRPKQWLRQCRELEPIKCSIHHRHCELCWRLESRYWAHIGIATFRTTAQEWAKMKMDSMRLNLRRPFLAEHGPFHRWCPSDLFDSQFFRLFLAWKMIVIKYWFRHSTRANRWLILIAFYVSKHVYDAGDRI